MADGVEVRSLEELREHFDLDKVTECFRNGKLLEWLQDRYYDEEVELILEIEEDAEHLSEELCKALGVDPDKYVLDPEFIERIEEKKLFLQSKIEDTDIIKNAKIVALTQEDLADLLDLDAPLIYLCGEEFHIPIRVTDKHYIGILGRPKVNIKATSQEELDSNNIILENVELPWTDADTNEVDDTSSDNNIKNVEGKIWEVETIIKNSAASQTTPAVNFTNTARKFMSKVQIIAKGKIIDAKSSLMINSLLLKKGDAMTIRAEGNDAADAVRTLKKLVDSGFGVKE
ncbi:MAG: HPr family phosphocarrier protein [Selenomonadaceae bacterium]|nr:HPr family phosphocarrier protein [Selenomonadaceae bacterium]